MSRPSSRQNESQAALSRAQGDDVLRYWLASLRLEEALQARPVARQVAGGAAVPRLEQPTPGQDYFKLPFDAALGSLLMKDGQVTKAFDAELSGFCETWLHGQYRKSDDETELSHLLCFPVVHLPKGELAGLVRSGVRLRFATSGGGVFRVPTRAERQRGAYPPLPDEVRLTRASRGEGAWPFFIDTRLLRHPLGVPAESIDALFEALRTLETVSESQMLGLLTVMLETSASETKQAPPEPEAAAAIATRLKELVAKSAKAETWLERLTSAMRRLLERGGSRARVYGVGIVVDGARAKTTWHLQREIEALVEGERDRWKVESPLGAYLTGKPMAGGTEPQRALYPGPALTASQRAAAEAFWGSCFSAVQGPPGTGKTRVILHLCAEHLVRQVESLLTGRTSPGLLLITSSNNRAVDNVLEPLGRGEGLPLALRAGSRQVCEHQLLTQLRRARSWLERAGAEPELERSARLAQAKAALLAQKETVERLLAPRRAAAELASKRARLEQELEEAASDAEPSLELSKPHAHLLLFALESLKNRLLKLSELCDAPAAPSAIRALERHFQRTSKRQLPPFYEALQGAKLTCVLPLPLSAANYPVDPEQQLEAWEEAVELSLSELSELRGKVQRGLSAAQQAERVRLLRAQLESLGAEPATEPTHAESFDQLSWGLFDAAVAAREAWARARATELTTAVSAALRTVEQERSLRPLFRSHPDAARLLCQLFGIWGSTLLSLGNCFPSDLETVMNVVIDEAGQCHPAHAVSALLRAESALVIGDVHQLSPVFELGADDEARLLRSCRLATPAERLLPYRAHADAEISSQSLADRAVTKRGTLTDHFRCQPAIIALSDALCGYGLTVHTARADRARHAPYLTSSTMLVDLRGQQTPLGGSWCNELELQETLLLVENLLQRGVGLEELAVITPYRGQLEQLRRGLAERRIPLESSPELVEGGGTAQRGGLALGTVHRFQGGERSIVLFTSVVTHPGSLGFLNARPNLLNVAVSRAQHHFVCLGDARVLAQGQRSRLLIERTTALLPEAYGGGSPAAGWLGALRL